MKNKKGISLIVLIVTIIVIIILAAAVILTLNKNNPIDSSRIAQLCENRDALNSAVQLYYGKKMAETQGVFSTKEIFTGGTAKDSAGTEMTVTSVVGDALGTSSYYLVNSATESAIDTKFPQLSNTTWYMDVTSGLVYLAYTDRNSMPTWMFKAQDKKELDTNLAQFVRIKNTTNNTLDEVPVLE